MNRGLLICAVVCLGMARSAHAQESPTAHRTPVSGSMVYHALRYGAPYGADAARSWGLRFAGRLALRLHDQVYVGFAVGSWQDGWGSCGEGPTCPHVTLERSAVASQLYVQTYPLTRLPLFLRGGAGIGQTRTLEPNGLFIASTDHVRLLVSGGIGYDWPLGGQIHLTPSVDYAILPAVQRESAELRSALAVGLGLSLR